MAAANRLLLTDAEGAALATPVRIDLGDQWNPFAIQVDARPLRLLADQAAQGGRVYEFLSIRRPGDLLNYWWVTSPAMDAGAIEPLEPGAPPRHPIRHGTGLPHEGISYVALDRQLHWSGGDDPYPEEAAWMAYRESRTWKDQAAAQLAQVKRWQERLRGREDLLLQREIRAIDEHRHPLDYLPAIERMPLLRTEDRGRYPTPPALMDTILALIRQDDVGSVSCPFDDWTIWRALVEEQVRRAERSGLPLQEAFTLAGPDSGLRHFPIQDWGGEVHVPYAGCVAGDLFILPSWRNLFPEHGGATGHLRKVVRGQCHYALVDRDLDELACAIRTPVGGWVLYQSRAPYVPARPLAWNERGPSDRPEPIN